MLEIGKDALRYWWLVVRKSIPFAEGGDWMISGLALIVGGAFGVSLNFTPLPTWSVVLIAGGVVLLIVTPTRIWIEDQTRLRPRLGFEAGTSRHIRPRIEFWAVVRVQNRGTERIEDCNGRVAEVLIEVGAEGTPVEIEGGTSTPLYARQFENQNIYLRWLGHASHDPYRAIHSEEVLEVAVLSPRNGVFHGYLAAVGDREYELPTSGHPCYVTIDFGAKNSAPVRKIYRLSMIPPDRAFHRPEVMLEEIDAAAREELHIYSWDEE